MASISNNSTNNTSLSVPNLVFWKITSGFDSHSISADPQYMDPELGSTQIFTTSPLVDNALASVLPVDDKAGIIHQYNAIGAWDPIPSYSKSNVTLVEKEAEVEITADASGQITINYSTVSTEQVEIRVIGLINQNLTISQRIEFTPENQQQVIDISAYPSGYYIVNMVTSRETISKKFYKR